MALASLARYGINPPRYDGITQYYPRPDPSLPPMAGQESPVFGSPMTGQYPVRIPLSAMNAGGLRGLADDRAGLATAKQETQDVAGHPSPVWGSPEWNATNDPQHAADIKYLNSEDYANDLNRVNPGLMGMGYYFHNEPGSGGTSLHSLTENDSGWVRVGRPLTESLAAMVGGAYAGSALGAGAEAGSVGEGAVGAGGAATGAGAGGGVSGLGAGIDEFGNVIGAGGSAAGIGTAGAASGVTAGAAGGAGGVAGGAGGSAGSAGLYGSGVDEFGNIVGAGSGGAGGSAGNVLEGTLKGGGSGTAMSRILDGTASTADWLSAGGNIGSSLLGVAGARKQANAYGNLADQYMAFGAPSRARYESSMTPGFDPNSIPGYAGAVDTASKGILARLAATGGNPWGNPGGLIEANKQIISGTALPAIQDYQRMNAGTGGYAGFNAAAPGMATAQIGAQGGVYNAVGSGLAGLTNPQPSIYDTLARLGVQGLS